MSHTSIETVSGIQVDVANPDPSTINIVDIAWGLSRQARFAGHTITDIPYSVAQHSVYVSELVERVCTVGDPLGLVCLQWIEKQEEELLDVRPHPDFFSYQDIERFSNEHDLVRNWVILGALLHDASEAYLVDLPSPVKRIPGIQEAYKVAENRLMDAIMQHCEVEYWGKWPEMVAKINKIIHWADMFARAVEAYHFMPSRGAGWGLPQPSISQLHSFRQPVDSLTAYHEFMGRYEDLQSRRGPRPGD